MNVRESDVERFLQGYGKVRDINLKRGYGFVVRRIKLKTFNMRSRFPQLSITHLQGFVFSLQEFDDYRDADDAVADLNGKELLGERSELSNYFQAAILRLTITCNRPKYSCIRLHE